MFQFEVPEVDLRQYSSKELLAPPFAVMVLAVAIIGGWVIFTGAPVTLGVEFTGGTELVMATNAPTSEIHEAFTMEISSIRAIGTGNSYLVTFQSMDKKAITEQAANAGFNVLQVQSTSATFGKAAQRLTLIAVAIAFLGMSVVVFALFRSLVPCLAIVSCAFCDIVVAVAMMNVFGVELSLGTVAALLMLIGYSVDSDILLTNHVLRRSGSFWESVERSMRTGVTMTITSIAATAVMAAVSYFFGIQLLYSIGSVLVFGLLADLLYTYMMNVSLLRWYKFEGVRR